jgi:hypothetical protein
MTVGRFQVQKGDFVVADADGRAQFVKRYGGSHSYKAGDEFEVTATLNGHLNVRVPGVYGVMQVDYDQVSKPMRRLGDIPAGGIDPEDPRAAWIFEDAARLADRLGLCKDYDRLCDELGLPGRVRTFVLTYEPRAGVQLTAKVKARSKRQAEEKLANMPPAVEAPKLVSAKAINA